MSRDNIPYSLTRQIAACIDSGDPRLSRWCEDHRSDFLSGNSADAIAEIIARKKLIEMIDKTADSKKYMVTAWMTDTYQRKLLAMDPAQALTELTGRRKWSKAMTDLAARLDDRITQWLRIHFDDMVEMNSTVARESVKDLGRLVDLIDEVKAEDDPRMGEWIRQQEQSILRNDPLFIIDEINARKKIISIIDDIAVNPENYPHCPLSGEEVAKQFLSFGRQTLALGALRREINSPAKQPEL